MKRPELCHNAIWDFSSYPTTYIMKHLIISRIADIFHSYVVQLYHIHYHHDMECAVITDLFDLVVKLCPLLLVRLGAVCQMGQSVVNVFKGVFLKTSETSFMGLNKLSKH